MVKNHKCQTNLSELLFYMEEMYLMDMLDYAGIDIYERYKLGNRIHSDECTYIHKQVEEWFFEKF